MLELENCKNCKKNIFLEIRHGGYSGMKRFVQCSRCALSLSNGFGLDKKEAVRKWNKAMKSIELKYEEI